ncbi:hypothetical protein AJ87_13395 [Rhizobium yanglingense]|nr:hypothetical protein AJ87_13395 [Rhizobium yanglingense]
MQVAPIRSDCGFDIGRDTICAMRRLDQLSSDEGGDHECGPGRTLQGNSPGAWRRRRSRRHPSPAPGRTAARHRAGQVDHDIVDPNDPTSRAI